MGSKKGTKVIEKACIQDYAVNHHAIFLMHQLGISLAGLTAIIAYLGITSGIGGKESWMNLQDTVGTAQQSICENVLCENIEKEITTTKSHSKKSTIGNSFTSDKSGVEKNIIAENKLSELLVSING